MFKRYELSDDKILKITRLCIQEQGTLNGIKAEASLAANILETNTYYAKKFGNDIYSFMRHSGWFAYAARYMDEDKDVIDKQFNAIKDILVFGNRSLPQHIDEHDCFLDIVSVSNYGKSFDKYNRSKYIKDVTVITNKYGSIYTFYCFPDVKADPFGYMHKPKPENKVSDNFVLVKVGD